MNKDYVMNDNVKSSDPASQRKMGNDLIREEDILSLSVHE